MNTAKKLKKKAAELNVTPKEYVDKMAADVQKLWKTLDISYDKFIRTTDDYHMAAVQQIFDRLVEQGDIYLENMKVGIQFLMKNFSLKHN